MRILRIALLLQLQASHMRILRIALLLLACDAAEFAPVVAMSPSESSPGVGPLAAASLLPAAAILSPAVTVSALAAGAAAADAILTHETLLRGTTRAEVAADAADAAAKAAARLALAAGAATDAINFVSIMVTTARPPPALPRPTRRMPYSSRVIPSHAFILAMVLPCSVRRAETPSGRRIWRTCASCWTT